MFSEVTLDIMEGHKALSNEQKEKIREYIKEGKHIFVLGAINSGKTTLARAIMLEVTDENTKCIGEIRYEDDVAELMKAAKEGKRVITTMYFNAYPHYNMPGIVENEPLKGNVVLIEMVELQGIRKVGQILEK